MKRVVTHFGLTWNRPTFRAVVSGTKDLIERKHELGEPFLVLLGWIQVARPSSVSRKRAEANLVADLLCKLVLPSDAVKDNSSQIAGCVVHSFVGKDQEIDHFLFSFKSLDV